MALYALNDVVLHEDCGHINVPLTLAHVDYDNSIGNTDPELISTVISHCADEYYEAMCYQCDDSAEAGEFHILMDGTTTQRILSVDTSETDTEWRCDGCGHFIHPNNENSEAHIYLST